jgi:ketosteroid isomerase-like protein
MTTRIALLAFAAVAALACSPHRIPGTEVRDSPENRAVYDVVQAYRQAMEKRDAAAVLALVAPDFFDTAGTPEPDDDLDRARLQQALPQDLAKADSVRLEFTIRKIGVLGDKAEAELFYDQYYRVQTPGGAIPRRDSDVHRMKLVKVEGAWKIQSGL